MYITNDRGKELSKHQVYGLNEYVGADFQLALSPKSEVVGHLLVGFSSSDSIRLDVDEYGLCNEKYNFELILVDAILDIIRFMSEMFLFEINEEKLKKKLDKQDLMFQKSELYNDGYNMHELQLSTILEFYQPQFVRVLKAAQNWLTNIQGHYWQDKDRSIYSMYLELDLSEYKKSWIKHHKSKGNR